MLSVSRPERIRVSFRAIIVSERCSTTERNSERRPRDPRDPFDLRLAAASRDEYRGDAAEWRSFANAAIIRGFSIARAAFYLRRHVEVDRFFGFKDEPRVLQVWNCIVKLYRVSLYRWSHTRTTSEEEVVVREKNKSKIKNKIVSFEASFSSKSALNIALWICTRKSGRVDAYFS